MLTLALDLKEFALMPQLVLAKQTQTTNCLPKTIILSADALVLNGLIICANCLLVAANCFRYIKIYFLFFVSNIIWYEEDSLSVGKMVNRKTKRSCILYFYLCVFYTKLLWERMGFSCTRISLHFVADVIWR